MQQVTQSLLCVKQKNLPYFILSSWQVERNMLKGIYPVIKGVLQYCIILF